MWNGSHYEKWTTVRTQEEYLAYAKKQFHDFAPVHTSINIAGTPDSGYGVYWIDKVLLEIDGPNREASYNEMHRLYAYLRINFSAEPRVYFSGNRSFHVYVDFLPLTLQEPDEVLREFTGRLQKETSLHLDFQVLSRRHLSRFPWTRNEKTCDLCLPVSPYTVLKDVSRKEFAVPVEIRYSESIRNALVRIDQNISSRPKPKTPSRIGTPPTSQWIENLLKRNGVADGRHRILWHVLAPYFVNLRKLAPESAEAVLREYFEKCDKIKPLQPSRSILPDSPPVCQGGTERRVSALAA
jgi:Primase X